MPLPSQVMLDLPGGGTATLRILLVRDEEEIGAWLRDDALPPRELTLRILQHQFISSSRRFEFAEASDPELADLLIGWIARSLPQLGPRLAARDLEMVVQALREDYRRRREELFKSVSHLIGADAIRAITHQQAAMSRLVEPWLAQQERIARTFQPIIGQQAAISRVVEPLLAQQAEISKVISAAMPSPAALKQVAQLNELLAGVEQLKLISDAFKFFHGFTIQLPNVLALPAFPDLSVLSSSFTRGLLGTSHQLLLRLHTQEQADKTLAVHNLHFVSGILPFAVVTRLGALRDPRDARAVMSRLRQWIRSEKFRNDFIAALEGHPRSRRRIHIIRDALDAHAARRYALSVPTLIAQAEGVITDHLAKSRLVRTCGGKAYAVVPGSREFKLDSKGKKIELRGLGPKLGEVKTSEGEILTDLASELVSGFVTRRNEILHGHDLRYATHKQSAYALLVLAAAAQSLSEQNGGK